jgi:Na+-driven multidrug efflux pump
LVAVASSGASLLAFLLLDILSLIYVSLLHDEPVLAAYGVAKTFTFLISTLQAAFVVSCAAGLSKLIGAGGRIGIAEFVRSLFVLSGIVIGVMVMAELSLFGYISAWLGVDPSVSGLCHEYVQVVLPATIVMTIVHLSTQILRTYGRVHAAMYVTACCTLFFAVSAPLLMFGCDMGLFGNALAFALTAILGACMGLIGIATCPGVREPRSLMRSFYTHSRIILRVAGPAWLGNLATFVGVACLLKVMVPFGVAALAAMTVLDRVIQTFYCFFFALPNALAPILGQNLGARETLRVRASIRCANRLVLGYGTAAWLAGVLLSHVLASFAGLSSATQSMIGEVLLYAGPLWVLIGGELVAVAVFVSFGRAWYVPVFAWLRATLGTIPFLWLGAHLNGSSGAFISMLAGNACVAVLANLTSRRISTGRPKEG